MIDATYRIEDNEGNVVNFGDTLIGRINYQIRIGSLVKIKTNPATYFAHCLDVGGREIKFDMTVDTVGKTATIDACSANSLIAMQTDFLSQNTITPIFEGFEEQTQLLKPKPTEAAFDLIVKRMKHVLDVRRTKRYSGFDFDYMFTFNKKKYRFGIDCIYDYKIKDGETYKIVKAHLDYRTAKLEIEGVKVAKHPKIIQLLKDMVS